MLNSGEIIRNFNLYLFLDIPLEEPYLTIYYSLENIFKDLDIYKTSDVGNVEHNVYYKKDRTNTIMYYKKCSGTLFIDTRVYSELNNYHNLDIECIENLFIWKVNLLIGIKFKNILTTTISLNTKL